MSGKSLYLIEGGDKIKVGVAGSPHDRLGSLQVGNPNKLKIIESIPFEEEEKAFEVENAVHNYLSEYHERGEWFSRDALPIAKAYIQGIKEESDLVTRDDMAMLTAKLISLGKEWGRNNGSEFAISRDEAYIERINDVFEEYSAGLVICEGCERPTYNDRKRCVRCGTNVPGEQ